MPKKVVLIDHPVGRRRDRAAPMIAELGYELQWCCPGRGEPLPQPDESHAAAVVYGGAENLSECGAVDYIQQELAWIEAWLETGKPFLGFCLGGQMLAHSLGAQVGPHPEGYHEIGFFELHPAPAANGFLAAPMHAYQWHCEGFALPAGAELLARSAGNFPNQAFRYGGNAYGLQFHPEVDCAIFSTWLDEVKDAEQRPGAHPRTRQVADAALHDAPVGDWLRRFLAGWLGKAG